MYVRMCLCLRSYVTYADLFVYTHMHASSPWDQVREFLTTGRPDVKAANDRVSGLSTAGFGFEHCKLWGRKLSGSLG